MVCLEMVECLGARLLQPRPSGVFRTVPVEGYVSWKPICYGIDGGRDWWSLLSWT